MQAFMHFMHRKFFSKEHTDTKIIMSRHIHICIGRQKCCLGLDLSVGKAGGGIHFGVDNYAYDTSTENIRQLCTNIVYLTQYLLFSFLIVAKVVFSFVFSFVVHLSKRNFCTLGLFDHWMLKMKEKN